MDETIAMFEHWYLFALMVMMKPVIGAVVAGLGCAFIFTQRYKMSIDHTIDDDRRRRMTVRFSFYCGSIPTLLLWPIGWVFEAMTKREIYLVLISGILAAALVGAAAPFSYAIIMNRLYKWGWAKELKWSGETNAAVKREESNGV